jgi:hypothetical protein
MFLVALVLCAPAYAQEADKPLIALDREPLKEEPCLAQPGDVVLKPDAAVAAAKRLSSAEAKVAVYEKSPMLPWWGVVIIGVVAAAAGAGVTIGIYEAGKARP